MSSGLSSDVLTPRQLTFIAERLPEPSRPTRGRRPYSNQDLLPGILRVLRSGCRSTSQGTRQASPIGVGCAAGTGGKVTAGSGTCS